MSKPQESADWLPAPADWGGTAPPGSPGDEADGDQAPHVQASPVRLRRDDTDVDVVVIGGGVNGVGVARDASQRGLRVALFERNDLAFGASGNSSGMIHGGPRYLTNDPHVTETSCRDSGHIQAIAPHLLFRIPFLAPVERSARSRVMFTLMDAFFEAYDRYQPFKRGKRHARLSADELRQLEPGLAGDLMGGFSMDEWGIDGARLCVANAVDAMERGAKVYVGHTVERVERREDTGAVVAVRYRDRHTGAGGRLRTSVVINATGAWSSITAALGGLPPTASRVRPGKGIHIVYDRRLTSYAIMGQTIDGRQIFMCPWENVTVIGTTDDDFYGDLDGVRANSEEVRYLVQGIARVFPAIRNARAIGTYAGVRPTLHAYGPSEDELSRDHQIIDHAVHGAPGLFSMIGGKLASYRLFSEEMADVLAKHFGIGLRCATHVTSLPGGDATVDPFALAERAGIDAVAARRLVYRHGSRALHVEERMKARPREAVAVCPCEPVTEAEVRYTVRHELARTVDDVSRRTRLGLGACGGMRCAARCGQIVASERGLPPREGMRQAINFLERQALTRVVALGPEQARQEALAIASVRSELGLMGDDDLATAPAWRQIAQSEPGEQSAHSRAQGEVVCPDP
ncbi:glycerol-3-phosphate dehydrogenase/oxidase [Chondromyces apiculatus]|uniref:glycerol-3-phosphate dehydrogenase/oxidase n=1 Tax=Chondromyces apiculatus TaxID=51 RepID=UPI001E3B89A3|nr:glycerol-3-phosphate dehydrogenase/oxidase [Chondromyces apiculatus]